MREQKLKNDNLSNYLNNDYKASHPLEKLCTDITIITYENGEKLYISAILDIYNRRILAYDISDKIDTNLVLVTLNQLPNNNLRMDDAI
ncbi:MAG: DDE-type integrase/transposase/recombinase [Candidatus Phytoplasma sp. TWB_XP]